jgi:beta-glucosidase
MKSVQGALLLALLASGVRATDRKRGGGKRRKRAQEAKDEAARLLSAMTQEEKLSLLHGHEGLTDFVGYVPGIDRLGIPPITMNDGPQGFRTQTEGMDGTSTQWPCALAIASTFDPAAAAAWARGMGEEFAGKGSNVQLGPGLNGESVG